MPSVDGSGQLLTSTIETHPLRLEDLGTLPQPKVGLGIRLGPVAVSIDPPVAPDALPGCHFQMGTWSRSVESVPNPLSVMDGTIA